MTHFRNHIYCGEDLHLHAILFYVQDVRRKVARVVAAKCTLAARVDSFHESSNGKVGRGRLSCMHNTFDKCVIHIYCFDAYTRTRTSTCAI